MNGFRRATPSSLHRFVASSLPPAAQRYNLTGLSQAVCPECGARFTLDELVASQPSPESAEIARDEAP